MASAFLPYGKIKIGEPDANAEYFASLRTKTRPIFLDCFFPMPSFPLEVFISGEKYVIYGQKGTGKTCVLRYIEAQTKPSSLTEFLVFKKALLEEIDLQHFGRLPLLLDEEALKRFKHYHHTIKRLLILIMCSMALRKMPEDNTIDSASTETKSLIARIRDSSVGDVIKFGMDSIASIFSSAGVDLEKVTDGKFLLEGGRLLKRSNDDLLNFLIRKLKRGEISIRLFLDEIHFAYRSEESLQQDAMLVRDTILAVQTLNERFSEEGVPALILAAVRSEYLEHPIISTADINHTIESVGYELTWSNFPQNGQHPLFDLIILRFKEAMGGHFNKDDFFRIYLGSIDVQVFLDRTWSKPRDFVRFFKCAQKLYPNHSHLTPAQSNAVFRNYAQEAWRELKSAAAPFLTPDALSLFEETLTSMAPTIFDGSSKYDVQSFGTKMRPVYELAKKNQANFYDFDHFMRLLYIVGIFRTRRHDSLDQDIYHSYHRGNRNYHPVGDVLLHPTVLKAFG